MKDQTQAGDGATAGVQFRPGAGDTAVAGGVYEFVCRDADGNVKWTETASNRIVDQGLGYMLAVAVAGLAAITTWFMGLKGTGAVAAGDTYASHAGWAELTAYSETARPAWTVPAGAALSKANGTAIRFTANGAMTVAGCFIASASAKGDTAAAGARLWGAVDFAAARTMAANDTLDVTYTATVAAA